MQRTGTGQPLQSWVLTAPSWVGPEVAPGILSDPPFRFSICPPEGGAGGSRLQALGQAMQGTVEGVALWSLPTSGT